MYHNSIYYLCAVFVIANLLRTSLFSLFRLQNFPHEAIVKQEVMNIVDTLQDESTDDSFLKSRCHGGSINVLKYCLSNEYRLHHPGVCVAEYTGIFGKLPVMLQCALLLQVAAETKDVIQHTRLMMLILTQYPDTVPIHGVCQNYLKLLLCFQQLFQIVTN